MSGCTGPCVLFYLAKIAKIVVMVWDEHLKEPLKDAVDETKTKKPLPKNVATSIRSQMSRPVSPFF